MTRLAVECLVDGAWKFPARQPLAEIEVGQIPDGAVFVRDNGVGFDARAHASFQPFRRFRAPDESGGTGVGLATVQRIMKRHGGRVWADSEPGALEQEEVGSKDTGAAWTARRDPWTPMPGRWPRVP